MFDDPVHHRVNVPAPMSRRTHVRILCGCAVAFVALVLLAVWLP